MPEPCRSCGRDILPEEVYPPSADRTGLLEALDEYTTTYVTRALYLQTMKKVHMERQLVKWWKAHLGYMNTLHREYLEKYYRTAIAFTGKHPTLHYTQQPIWRCNNEKPDKTYTSPEQAWVDIRDAGRGPATLKGKTLTPTAWNEELEKWWTARQDQETE